MNLKNILLATQDIMQEPEAAILEHKVKAGDKPYTLTEYMISKELTDKQIADDLKEGVVTSYLLKIINDHNLPCLLSICKNWHYYIVIWSKENKLVFIPE